jgi:hypothetical protein
MVQGDNIFININIFFRYFYVDELGMVLVLQL